MCKLETMIPEYVRLNRTYRDIPASEILHGSTLSNLRQIVEEKLKKENKKLIDIRHREIKNKVNNPENAVLKVLEYDASEWKEYFLSFEDPYDRTIFSLLRMRIPWYLIKSEENFEGLPELKWASLIREIHTFWDQLSIGEKGSIFGQHIGFWKKLIAEAERITKEHNIKKIAVIAGVGVRQYYEKRDYHLEGEYMVKKL